MIKKLALVLSLILYAIYIFAIRFHPSKLQLFFFFFKFLIDLQSWFLRNVYRHNLLCLVSCIFQRKLYISQFLSFLFKIIISKWFSALAFM